MSVSFYGESPGKFDSRTLSRKTLSSWTGRTMLYNVILHNDIVRIYDICMYVCVYIYIYIYIYVYLHTHTYIHTYIMTSM